MHHLCLLGMVFLVLESSSCCCCDGLTGVVEERMKTEYTTKSGHMMVAMNKWSIMYLGIGLAITGEELQFIGFLQRHPSVIWELATFSVAVHLASSSSSCVCLSLDL